MIRSVRLVCAECGSEFVPEGGVLYYKDNYINNTRALKNGTKNGRLKMPDLTKWTM